MPKRNVGVLQSVKDTIRRARLNGAAEAVKFIKLFSQVLPAREIAFLLFLFFLLFFCFKANSLFQEEYAVVERAESGMIWSLKF